jgi:hypothetical protein
MSAAPTTERVPSEGAHSVVVVVLVVALAVVWGVRLWLLPTLNVNWDEFYFLSQVHALLRGELSAPYLTFHAHLLGWVVHVADNEVDQVLALRGVMAACGAIGTAATIVAGRALGGTWRAGLVAAVAAAGFSLVIQFGCQARFDPLVANLFVCSVALLLQEKRRFDVFAGALFAVALLISVKASLYAPALFLVWLGRGARQGSLRAALRGALGAAAPFLGGLVCVLVPLAVWHVHGLAPAPPGGGIVAESSGLAAIATKVAAGLFSFPQHKVLLRSLSADSLTWGLLGLALVAALLGLGGAATRARALVALGLLAPLCALTFYRNSFPYFYVTLMLPACLAISVLDAALVPRLPAKAVGAVAVVFALVGVGKATRFAWANGDDQVAHQRAIVDAVHAVFPEPVPYIDRCGMVASFPKVGPFMSTWSLENYRGRKVPLFRELLAARAPLFVVDNVSGLSLAAASSARGAGAQALLPEDFAVLRDNYVRHWGPLWIAGKRVHVEGSVDVHVEFAVPGRYVVDAAVSVDGVAVGSGAVVDVDVGDHVLRAPASVDVGFRVAAARPPPPSAPPSRRVFSGFTSRSRPARAAVDAAPDVDVDVDVDSAVDSAP